MKLFISIVLILLVFPVFCFAVQEMTYFSEFVPAVVWATTPSYMVDGYLESYAITTINRDEEVVKTLILDDDIAKGKISKVEIRACGFTTAGDIILVPSTGGSHVWTPTPFLDCSAWYDITGATDWDWTTIKILNVKVYPDAGVPFQANVSMVWARITHESKSAFIENTTTGAEFYLDKHLDYGDFLNVFFYPLSSSCLLSK